MGYYLMDPSGRLIIGVILMGCVSHTCTGPCAGGLCAGLRVLFSLFKPGDGRHFAFLPIIRSSLFSSQSHSPHLHHTLPSPPHQMSSHSARRPALRIATTPVNEVGIFPVSTICVVLKVPFRWEPFPTSTIRLGPMPQRS
jgi:hypothetical protein